MLARLALTAAAAALCLAFTGTASAQISLEVGGTAPGLDVKKWFNGEGPTIEPGRIYIVEFWATWCGPCKKSIPHLNELHNKYSDKGLTIIGISDEAADIVEPFVKSQGDRMAYLVGADRQKSTSRAWMQAANQKGIPCAFIVDKKSKVVFIGHPLDSEFDRVITLVMSGKYDPKKEARAKPAIDAAERAAKLRNWREAYKHFDEVINLDQNIFSEVARRKFEMMLADEQNTEGAYKWAEEMFVKIYNTDATMLQTIAHDITVNPKYTKEQRNIDVAMKVANRALELAGDKDPPALATVALVQFHKGEVKEAIDNQMQAWMIAPADEKAEYRRVLENYRSTAERTAKR